MDYSLYELVWFFFIYAFFGWCAEVAYAAVCHGKFVNRGFLCGPLCPIYGFGAVLVIVVLTPIENNLAILFFGSVLLTSLIELIGGFVLEKIFKQRWWDYSDVPFNIGGYICLKFSLLWGLACVGVMRILQPLICIPIQWLPRPIGYVILSVIAALFVTDIAVTAAMTLRFTKRLSMITELNAALHKASDKLGSGISEETLALMDKYEKFSDKHELKERRSRYEEKKKKLAEKLDPKNVKAGLSEKTAEISEKLELNRIYESILSKRSAFEKRMLAAFPKMKSKKYQDAIEKLRNTYRRK